MIQQILTKYAVALHIAVIGAFAMYSLIWGPAAGAPFFWLALIALEVVFVLPSVHHDESLVDARWRVLSSAVSDPIFYLLILAVSLSLVSGINGGCSLEYESGADIWQMGPPKVAWLPFAVKAPMGYRQAAIVFAALLPCLIFRDAISKNSMRLVLQILSFASGAVAVICVALCLKAAPAFQARLGTSGIQAAGVCFGFWAILAAGVNADMILHNTRWELPVMLFGVIGNAIGLLFFAELMTGLLFFIVLAVVVILSRMKLVGALDKKRMIKESVVLLLFVAAAVFLFVYVFPDNPIAKKVAQFHDFGKYAAPFFADRSARAGLALQIFQDYPWLGTGAGGFGAFAGLYIPEGGANWSIMGKDAGFVLDDYLQALCESGIIGAAIILSIVVVLLIPICLRLRICARQIYISRFSRIKKGEALDLSPIVVPGLAALCLLALAAGFGNPFMEPAAAISGCLAAACLPSFLPERVTMLEAQPLAAHGDHGSAATADRAGTAEPQRGTEVERT